MGVAFHWLFDSAIQLALDKSCCIPNLSRVSTAEFSEDEIDSLNLRCLATDI
jgi:hypothetical protein